jgi:hypothetical protein
VLTVAQIINGACCCCEHVQLDVSMPRGISTTSSRGTHYLDLLSYFTIVPVNDVSFPLMGKGLLIVTLATALPICGASLRSWGKASDVMTSGKDSLRYFQPSCRTLAKHHRPGDKRRIYAVVPFVRVLSSLLVHQKPSTPSKGSLCTMQRVGHISSLKRATARSNLLCHPSTDALVDVDTSTRPWGGCKV